ncbi:MAG: DNA-binding protein [Rhodocyclaceae bacterium]|nr:MAG: DNA-binding protein [Rhodocyclaceae bacterium]
MLYVPFSGTLRAFNQGIDIAVATRQERVFDTCDQIVRESIAAGQGSQRPTVGNVRERGIKGSQNDIQQDIHAWHMLAYQHHLEAGQIEGIPQSVVTTFQSFWQAAQAEARAVLEAERAAIQASNAELQATIEILTTEKAEAWAAHADLERQLSDEKDVVKGLEQQASDLKASVIAKDERLQGLNDQLAATIQSHGVEIARIQGESSVKIQELEDARKYAITQIDVARESERQLKTANQELQAKLDGAHTIETALRQRAVGAESDLASEKAVKDVLKSRIQDLEQGRDAAVGQAAVLNANLETERAGRQTLEQEYQTLNAEIKERSDLIETLHKRIEGLEAKAYKEKR